MSRSRPFNPRMQISGNSSVGANYDMAVAKKSLQSTREQGKQALQLIQSAMPAPTPGVGGNLNIKA